MGAGGAILALDQGTTSTKALVVCPDGSIAAKAEVPVSTRSVGPDGVECDAIELWESLLTAGRRAADESGQRLCAVALANQGETVVAWRRQDSRPVSPAISWQDRRAESVCSSLRSSAELVREVTGLELDPYFSAPKMTWLRERVGPGPVISATDCFLLHRLCGAYVTDAATASRTLLLDLDGGGWSETMCRLFEIEQDSLPEIVANTAIVGTTRAFGSELPVVGISVDQQAALFAEGCLQAGTAKCTYGTGAFLLATVGDAARRSGSGLSACVAWRLGDATTYCLDGQIYSCGTAVGWLIRMGLVASPSQLDELAHSAGCAGMMFVPALSGLAAPYWAPGARGLLAGVSLDTAPADVVAAVLDGIAANVTILADAVADDLGARLARLRADGGLTRSTFLMQRQADLLQMPVDVYATPHATALGVAAMARLGLGEVHDARAAVSAWSAASSYEPRWPADRAAQHLARWRRAADGAVAIR